MNNVLHDTICERCLHPIGDQGYRIEVVSDPPRSDRIELQVCLDCMGSLQHWMRKRTGGRAARRRHRPRRTAFNEILDRHERTQQRWLRWGWMLPMTLLLLSSGAVASYVLVTRLLRGGR